MANPYNKRGEQDAVSHAERRARTEGVSMCVYYVNQKTKAKRPETVWYVRAKLDVIPMGGVLWATAHPDGKVE